MKEEQDITIRIADQDPFPMTIPRKEEETIRVAERNVNELFRLMSKRFNQKTPMEVMAMVAFQFARQVYGAKAHINEVSQALIDFEHDLDAMLGNTPRVEPRGESK